MVATEQGHADPNLTIAEVRAHAQRTGGRARVALAQWGGQIHLVGVDTVQVHGGEGRDGFVLASAASSGLGRRLLAERLRALVMQGSGVMHVEVGSTDRTLRFHQEVVRVGGVDVPDLHQNARYRLQPPHIARLLEAWDPTLTGQQRADLLRLDQSGRVSNGAVRSVLCTVQTPAPGSSGGPGAVGSPRGPQLVPPRGPQLVPPPPSGGISGPARSAPPARVSSGAPMRRGIGLLAGNEFLEHVGNLLAIAYMNNSSYYRRQAESERAGRAQREREQWTTAVREIIHRARPLPPPPAAFARAVVRVHHGRSADDRLVPTAEGIWTAWWMCCVTWPTRSGPSAGMASAAGALRRRRDHLLLRLWPPFGDEASLSRARAAVRTPGLHRERQV